MNRPVTIVVLAKHACIFRDFVATSDRFIPKVFPRILVRDGNEIADPTGWKVIQGPEKFAMAGNANLGLRAVAENSDVLYCGDDIRFLEESTLERLREIAHQRADMGILSPRLLGRGSPVQVDPPSDISYVNEFDTLWFPCVYIKREVMDKIGFLDERFNDYGYDDIDYCIRTRVAGFRYAVAKAVTVRHESSDDGGSTTFDREVGRDTVKKQAKAAREKLRLKWNLSESALHDFLKNGDCSKVNI